MTLNHTHQLYDNQVIAKYVENQLYSALNLMPYCTIDDSLVGVPGDKVHIFTYKTTTDKTEILAMGEGNTKNIEVLLSDEEYPIQLYQNRFPWYDEQAMKDPKAIEVGANGQAMDMYNKFQKDVFAEFQKATIEMEVPKFNFDIFVDAVAEFGGEEKGLEHEQGDETGIFCFISKHDKAEIRKELKDDLKYVESYARTGYIGHVAGVPLIVTNHAVDGQLLFATKKAVGIKLKKGLEHEPERDPNIRLNNLYLRQYAIPYFADAREAVKVTKAL